MGLMGYFADLRGYAPLSLSQESELLERLKRKPCAEDRALLVTSNLRFTVLIASRYRGHGVPLEDLVNEGNIGLIEAAQRYDPQRGVRFLTYAVWWIRKSILAAISEQSLIRIPQYRKKQIKDAREKEDALSREEPAPPESRIDRAATESIRELDNLLKAFPQSFHLVDLVGTGADRPVDDYLEDTSAVSAEDRMLQDESDVIVEQAISFLSPLERKIIRGRFGMDGGRPLALKELAQQVGLSRERVRQIELKAKDKIRRAIVRRAGSHSTHGPKPTVAYSTGDAGRRQR